MRGVIYFAVGRKHLKMAIRSARSLRRFEPDLPVVLFTGRSHRPQMFSPFDKIVEMEITAHPLKQKIVAISETPFTETLYLDADTKVFDRVSEPFEHLKKWDFLLGAMSWVDKAGTSGTIDFVAEAPNRARKDLPHLNTGVIYFRDTPKTRTFLNIWIKSIDDVVQPKGAPKLHCDQHQFNTLLGEQLDSDMDISVGVLSNKIWNCRNKLWGRLSAEEQAKVRIFHCKSLDSTPTQRRISNTYQRLNRRVARILVSAK